MAALLLGAVNMAVAWAPTLAVYQASGLFVRLGVDGRFGLGLIDAISLILQFSVLLLVSRAGSQIARIAAIMLAVSAVLAIVQVLAEQGAVPGARGMLAVLCILLQSVGVAMLMRPEARRWFGRKG